jgi:hypothetical protein
MMRLRSGRKHIKNLDVAVADPFFQNLRVGSNFLIVFYFDKQVKNPQRDLPVGIAGSLSLCCGLYMIVSIVVVGLVPYYDINPDTPISSAFADNGMQWAA